MMSDGHGFGFGGAFIWLFRIALIAVVIWVVKAASGAGSANRQKRKTPLEILQERFARGENGRNTRRYRAASVIVSAPRTEIQHKPGETRFDRETGADVPHFPPSTAADKSIAR